MLLLFVLNESADVFVRIQTDDHQERNVKMKSPLHNLAWAAAILLTAQSLRAAEVEAGFRSLFNGIMFKGLVEDRFGVGEFHRQRYFMFYPTTRHRSEKRTSRRRFFSLRACWGTPISTVAADVRRLKLAGFRRASVLEV